MTEAFKTRALAYFNLHEGRKSWLYCDIRGLPTTGVGFLVPSAEAMSDYGFRNRASWKTATDGEKRIELSVIRGLGAEAFKKDPKKMPTAEWYKPYTTLELPDAEITRLLEEKLTYFDGNLLRRFPTLAAAPDSAHLGVLDMAYSMGIVGMEEKFPIFCESVRRTWWWTCMRQCEREGVSKARNEATAALFREAASSDV